jgi:hypothetical protein
MGRNIKEGLSYFPLDIDFFEDEKVQFLSARFGVKGDGILIRLLCKIYRQGYSIEFNEDVALLFARSVGDINLHGLVKDVVNELLKRGFFDEGIFKRFGLLTSKGIQKRYVKICTDAKRKEWQIPEKIDLIHRKIALTPEEIALTHEESTQRKEKKRKEKERIEGIGDKSPPIQKSFKNFSEQDFIDEIAVYKHDFEKDILNNFFKYWKEKSASGKMRFQLEKTWETKLRLEKWKSNQQKFNHNGNTRAHQAPGKTIEFDKL